jgi:uncharacterized protein (TIRG00374 family)
MRGSTWQRVVVALVGVAVSGVFVALALHRLDFRSVLGTMRDSRPWPWLPLAVLAYSIGHFLRGQRLRVLMRAASLPLPTATNIVVVGYASNNVFPARLGELVRAGMLAERTGIPVSQALTITFIERLFDGIAILVLMLAGAAGLAVRTGWIWDVARAGSLVFGVALAVLLVAVFLPGAVLGAASRMSGLLGPRARDRALALASSVTSAGATLRQPRDAFAIGGYSLAVWLFEALMFALLLPAFGMRFAIAPAVLAMSVTNLGILVPSSPGFVGSFHFFCSQSLASQGVAAATAMGYAVVVHLAFFVPVTLWGAGAMLWYGIQVGATAAMVRAARTSPQSAVIDGVPVCVIARVGAPSRPSPATPFDIALTEALLTEEGTAMDRDSLVHVATFLAQEMESLPPRLRFLYRGGMASFRLFVRITRFHSFCSLDVSRRRATVNTWAFGRIGLLRQLFRPPRSTVLLAYYERDAVARALSPVPVAQPMPLAFETHG